MIGSELINRKRIALKSQTGDKASRNKGDGKCTIIFDNYRRRRGKVYVMTVKGSSGYLSEHL